MGRRAEVLANRVAQGAEQLATFAESLTDAQWSAPVPPDGRAVGVMIHHVASVYPLEVDLARKLGSGEAIAGVTWGDVAKMNAQHSHDHASAGRKETAELVRKNGRTAADQIRQFSDEMLDSAAPISLNGNAPLTCQFFVEDHALRHSWHHLAKVRAALGMGV